MKKTNYSAAFYNKIENWSTNAANEIVPLVMNLVSPESVVDIGCGDGTWLSIFSKNGVEDILGIDGSYVTENILKIPLNCFFPWDLNLELPLEKKFDLAICLEVAEHLLPSSSRTIVKSLIKLSDIVLFSSAIPLQGGNGHLNEQWPNYWKSLFSDFGYVSISSIKTKLWNNPQIEYFYKQNVYIFCKPQVLSQKAALAQEYQLSQYIPDPIIHPDIYMELSRGIDRFSVWEIMNKIRSRPKNKFLKILKRFQLG